MSIKVHSITNNPFQENTYILASPSGKAAIIDPGMYDTSERDLFLQLLKKEGLEPVMLLNTHSHLDHVFGNSFVSERYGLGVHTHKEDLQTLEQASIAASMYGVNLDTPPEPKFFISDGDSLELDGYQFEVRFCPGHSPGHTVFVFHDEKFIVGGDVLFEGSVGRVDLPGGNAEELEKSIREKLYTLPDDFTVFSGHGGPTTIGQEKRSNYFVFEGGSRLL